jgi:hypothetical protein
MERQQRTIESRILVRLRQRLDVRNIKQWPRSRRGLRRWIVPDETNEFDRHGSALAAGLHDRMMSAIDRCVNEGAAGILAAAQRDGRIARQLA